MHDYGVAVGCIPHARSSVVVVGGFAYEKGPVLKGFMANWLRMIDMSAAEKGPRCGPFGARVKIRFDGSYNMWSFLMAMKGKRKMFSGLADFSGSEASAGDGRSLWHVSLGD